MSSEILGNPDVECPWLVLVHGMSQNRLVFDRQVERFASSYRILLIDLPGHGRASDHPGPFGHAEFAAHVAKALDDNGVERAHYWGTHTGTAAGLIVAASGTNTFASMVLEGPVLPGQNVPCVTTEIAKARHLASHQGLPAAIEAWWSEAPWFDYMRQHPEAARAHEHRAIVDDFSGRPWIDKKPAAPLPDLSGELAQLKVPTLIYCGEFDHPEFVAEAKRLEQLMPSAERKIVPDAGGFPAWEQPDSTNEMVHEFLEKIRCSAP